MWLQAALASVRSKPRISGTNLQHVPYVARWKSYPIMVTAWSYGFGAVAMGLATIYYYNHPDQFVLPGKVLVFVVCSHAVAVVVIVLSSMFHTDVVRSGLCRVHHFGVLLPADHVGKLTPAVHYCHCVLASTGLYIQYACDRCTVMLIVCSCEIFVLSCMYSEYLLIRCNWFR